MPIHTHTDRLHTPYTVHLEVVGSLGHLIAKQAKDHAACWLPTDANVEKHLARDVANWSSSRHDKGAASLCRGVFVGGVPQTFQRTRLTVRGLAETQLDPANSVLACMQGMRMTAAACVQTRTVNEVRSTIADTQPAALRAE